MSVTVTMPSGMNPQVIIPNHIAADWMLFGKQCYEIHNSEWGCAVKLERDSDYDGVVRVTDYKVYNLDASSAYWECLEGERQKHMMELIENGEEDTVHQWNGLFHTHPIGSSAAMSGTDTDQLKELCEPNWWAVSIISPANKSGAIIPDKFLAHYGDARQFGGTTIVENMPVTIQSVEPQRESEIISILNDTVSRRLPKTKPNSLVRHGGNSNDHWYQGRLQGYSNQCTDFMGNSLFTGDLVYLLDCVDYTGIENTTNAELINSMKSRVWRVESTNKEQVKLNGFWFDTEYDLLVRLATSYIAKKDHADIKDGTSFTMVKDRFENVEVV